MSWICPNQENECFCKLRKKECEPRAEGCVLAGKFEFVGDGGDPGSDKNMEKRRKKMKNGLLVLSIIVLFSYAGFAVASEGYDRGEHKGSMMGHHGEGESEPEAINVGNKICPVSGETIVDVGEPVPVEYNGKIYNLCCKMCAKSFKKDPEKYIKIVEESIEEEAEGSQDGHTEHHHE